MGLILQNENIVGGIDANVVGTFSYNSLTTTDKTLPGAINELNNKASTTVSLTQQEYDALPSTKLSDDIAYYITDGTPDVDNSLWTKVGTATLNTTAKDCSGAINEHESDISTLNSKLAGLVKYRTVTDTTTNSGAFLMPSDLMSKPIIDVYPSDQNNPFMVFRRGRNYFTCFKNDMSAPVSNTEVTLTIWYFDTSIV